MIIINNDRIEGYETASKETDEIDLKSMFAQFISTSQRCRMELVMEVNKMGGKPAEGTLTSGKLFRAWMEVKAAITGKDRKAILGSCEFGEDTAQAAYDSVLKTEMKHLSPEQQSKVLTQKSWLRADHNHVKVLRDALVDA